jgi:dihydrofolate reductase
MGKLIYSMITSLDGFVSDPAGNFGWGAPEQESHEFINRYSRSIGTYSDLALSVDGPHLAAQAIRAGLVDEYQLFVGPAIVGGGTPLFPDDVRVDLELLDERRFGNGVVYLRYGVKDHRRRA